MDGELICNFKKCRKTLTTFAWVTSCSHIFCNEDGMREFAKAFVCPACETQLPGKLDIVRIDLNPSEQYKSMLLAGQKPDIILEICSRAMAFWSYQVHQETMYQQYAASKLRERISLMEDHYEQSVQKSRSDLSALKLHLESVKKEAEVLRNKCISLSEKLMEKKRQHQKLLSMYEELRRKCVSPGSLFGDADARESRAPTRNSTRAQRNLGLISAASELITPQKIYEAESTESRNNCHQKEQHTDFHFQPLSTRIINEEEDSRTHPNFTSLRSGSKNGSKGKRSI